MTRTPRLSLLGPSSVLFLVACAGLTDSETGRLVETGGAAVAGESDTLDDGYDPDALLLFGTGADDDGDEFATSLDCDDTNPLINPAAAEVDNGVDDDCDGYIDEDFVSVGDLVISEINRQAKFGGPVAVPDGSWVEVTNVSARTVNLANWTFARTDGTTVTQVVVDPTAPVVILPGESAVFCDTDNYQGSAATYPLTCDYVWGDETQSASYRGTYHNNTFYLRRDKDSFGLYVNGSATTGTLIDQVAWTYDAVDGYWPRTARFSTSLDPDYLDATLNDGEDVWCSTSSDATGRTTNSTTWAWYDTPSTSYDEHGTPGAANYACQTTLDKDADGYDSTTDCNDNNAAINPGATEVCDGVDQDCDGIIDDGTGGGTFYYPDADSDTYGDPDGGVTACAQPAGYVLDATDCDDTNGSSNPAASEICDGEDNDCDGSIDEGLTTGSNVFYADTDVDGYGDVSDTTTSCTAPAGYVADSTDCAPTDDTVHPGAAEADNLVDDDCDDYVDEDFITAGSLVITEVNRQSRFGGGAAVPNGTWVEVINDSTRAIDLSNMTIARGTSSSGKQVHIDPSLAPLLAPGERAVFCDSNDYEADTGVAWPLACDYIWGDESQPSTYVGTYHDNTFALQANSDTFAIYSGGDRTTGLLLDAVTWYYDATNGYWPRVARFSMSLDPAYIDATLNDDVSTWCSTTQSSSGTTANDTAWRWYDTDTTSNDEHGTPGAANYDCPVDPDLDSDGYTGATDCDDTDPAINPGAAEACDGIDNDCDGLIDEGTGAGATWYADTDGDTFGDAASTVTACSQPAGYVDDNTDCDDTNALSNPTASEICDGQDNDCDILVDEEAADATIWYADFDADTYGDPLTSISSCTQPDIYVADNTDCNDSATAINPGVAEVCDLVDNDCDGQIDEIGATGGSTYYTDADGDTYGNAASSVSACSLPSGYSVNSTDCDDALAATYPGAPELCDGNDNDCDGTIDDGAPLNTYYADTDADGYGDPASTSSGCVAPSGYVADNTDCAPADGAVSPGATEVCNDHVDQNCDPTDCEWGGEQTAKAIYDMRFYGTSASWAVGTSIANNGDFNGDGYDDPVFGAAFMENSTLSDNGAVYVYYGPVSTSDDMTTYDLNIWGDTSLASDYLGSSVRYIADMDADSDDELLVSAWKSGASDNGTTYLFKGGTSPTSYTAAFATFTSTDANAYMGQSIDGNDLDADGIPEVIVSAHNRTSGAGALGLWNGAGISGAEDLATTSSVLFTGSAASDNFGHAAMFVTDLDGDNVDDLVVGAPSTSTSVKGHAYIWYNVDTLSGTKAYSTADAIITGSAAGDRLGYAVASLGDTDLDGQNEVLITADKNDGAATDAGVAYIWDSAPSGASVAVTSASSTIRGEFNSDFFGRTAAGLGDINDDGYDDFAVGATGADDATYGSGCGSVYLWYGPAPTGTTSAGGFDALFTGANDADAVGYAIAGGGDVNGDNYPDFMLSATSWDSFGILNAGAGWVYYGRSE